MQKKQSQRSCLSGSLFTVSFLDLRTSYGTVKGYIEDFMYGTGGEPVTLAELIANVDAAVGEEVYAKYTYVEGYGFFQKLLFKKEMNNFEIVQAKDGYLHYTYFTNGPNDVESIVGRMKRLKKAADKHGSKLMYLMTPDKYIRGVTRFERGIPYNYANETADNFLKALEDNGIDTLDFRDVLKTGGKTHRIFIIKRTITGGWKRHSGLTRSLWTGLRINTV